jgi:aminomethyltransferase
MASRPVPTSATDVPTPPLAAGTGDARLEFRALRQGCGVCDLSELVHIRLRGGDHVRWLNGMITNNVRDLAPGAGVYAYLLNPQGRIQADLYAYSDGDTLLVTTDRSQQERLLSIFDQYIIMDDVEIAAQGDAVTAVGVRGPKAAEVLRTVGLDPGELAPLHFEKRDWRGTAVMLLRAEAWLGNAYEVWLGPASASLLRTALLEAGATAVGAEAQRWFRLAAGIPRFGEDIRERDLPQETVQDKRALHFAKGCYVGQEIVERIHSRGLVHRMFAGFVVDGALPAPGTKIQIAGGAATAKNALGRSADVGEVTSSATLPGPTGPLHLALGYIRREAQPQELDFAGARGRAVTLPAFSLLEQ